MTSPVDSMRTVLHTKVPFSFLPGTEVFIARQIARLTRYRSLAAARHRERPDLYPGLPLATLDDLPAPRRALERLRFRWFRRHGFLADLAHREHVDLVHGHFGPCAWFALRQFRRERLPVVAHFYGRDATALVRDPTWAARYKELFQGAALVLALSRSLARHLLEAGCPEEKIRIHPLGVDLEQFTPPDTPPPAAPLRLLFVGRMVPKKDPLGLLEALRAANAQLPEWTLSMLGGGELAPLVAGRAAQLGWGDRVDLPGEQDHEAVRQAMGSHHLLVLPACTGPDGDEEGQALVLQEAQARGLPVVSTLHDGIPEGVRDGITGLLVPPGDYRALAEALVRLGSDSTMRTRMGLQARSWVQERFDEGALARRLEDLYDEVLEGA